MKKTRSSKARPRTGVSVVTLRRRVAELETEVARLRSAARQHRRQDERTADAFAVINAAGTLVESNRAYQAMIEAAFDNAPFEFWARDRNGVGILENKAIVRHWGSILGKRPEDSPITHGSLAIWQDNNRRAYAGETVQGEVEFIEGGEKRTYYNSVAPIRVGRTIQGILGFNIDITNLKRAEAELRRTSLSCQMEEEIIRATHHEQSRIGRDLHDGVCQLLVAAQLTCQSLHRKLAARAQPEAHDVEELQGILKRAILQARSVTQNLIPTELESGGLASALENLASDSAARYRIPCSFRASPKTTQVDSTGALHLYRIAQEAVYNAARHAHPRHIAITLQQNDHHTLLTVADDGRGIPVKPRRRRGMGLPIMQHRARMIGGNLTIQAGTAGGTRITCTCPHRPLEQ